MRYIFKACRRFTHTRQLSFGSELRAISPKSCEETLYHTRSTAKLRNYHDSSYDFSRKDLESTESTPTISAPDSQDDYGRLRAASGPSSAMKWTDQDIQTLTSLREKGTAWSAIAKKLGRSQRACQLKQTHLRSRAHLCPATRPKPLAATFGRRKPFFEKNPEKVEAVLASYELHKKAFWQAIAKEVGCSWTAAERKVMDALHDG